LGGEEFLCACQPISIDDMTIICERIRTSVEKAELQINNAQISMTISGGIAHSKDMSGDYSTYLTFADEKLYEAKNGGRNRIIL
jgi:diguanylate cyclase (GGDEF)-like protein